MLVSEYLEQLGSELVKARKLIFPTAAAFAEYIEVSRQTLDQWEKKNYEGCQITTYIKVVKALENQSIFQSTTYIDCQ